MEELLARLKARLRRTQPNDPAQLQFEDLILKRLTREVYRGSQLIALSGKELDWL
jgi:DNA-binding response OmpR family regulator